MPPEFVRWIFLGVACMFVALWVGIALIRRPASPPGDEVVTLRHSPMLRGLALLFALSIPMLMGYVMAKFVWGSLKLLLLAGGSMSLLSLLGGLLLVEACQVALHLTSDALVLDSPWRRRRTTIRWGDMSRVTFSNLNQWYVFRDAVGITIRASAHLVGISHLLTAIRVRIPPERWHAIRTRLDADTRSGW